MLQQSSSYATGKLELLVHLNNPASKPIILPKCHQIRAVDAATSCRLQEIGDWEFNVQRSALSAQSSDLRVGTPISVAKVMVYMSWCSKPENCSGVLRVCLSAIHTPLYWQVFRVIQNIHKLDYAARTGSALSYHIMIGLCLFDIPVGTPRAGSPLEHSYFERNFNRHDLRISIDAYIILLEKSRVDRGSRILVYVSKPYMV